MSYRVAFEERPGYFYAHIEGPESYSEALRFWESLSEKSRTGSHRKFLIVDEVTGKLSTGEIFALSEKVANLFLGKVIAYVDPKEETFDANKFGETVVSNRGVVAKVLRSEGEAIIWLSDK
jgi:hypothetical protein